LGSKNFQGEKNNMHSVLRRPVAIGFFAIGLSLLSQVAQADTPLPGLQNLNFLDYTGNAPKDSFTSVDPVGWTGGSGLIYIDAPGTSTTSPTTACGTTYLSTWGCPSTLNIPGGYNEVEADGNPDFGSGFNYTVNGLVAGETYTLSFYQAASQQGPIPPGFANSGPGFVGDTTEQWIVSLGTSGLVSCPGCLGGGNSFYSNADPNASIMPTNVMSTPSMGLTDWNFVTVDLTADVTGSEVLSFLAWGDNGSTANLPPMVFLAGVDSPAGITFTPEPGSVLLFGTMMLGLGWAIRRQRAASKA
jgi:hypothetical protein